VDDEATQALMSRFHQLWRREGHPTAQALQQAQREIARQERWSHPRYWGAWVLWGLSD
jgi:CHAT domain-containing protein